MPNFVMEGTGTVCVLSGRTYTKVNAGFAIVGIYVNQGQYTGPLIVSETANAVVYSATSGGPWSYSTTITHNGKTYYVNNTEHFYGGDPSDTSGSDRYKCSATTPAAAAEELLTAYEESIKPYTPSAGQIADFDGTVYSQIGKIYDDDGTAKHQIAKVYDNDGTVNRLIYSSVPEYLYNAGDEISAITGGWVASSKVMSHVQTWSGGMAPCYKNADSLQVESGATSAYGQYNGSGFITANAIDFSEINTITVGLSSNEGSRVYSYFIVALVSDVGGTIHYCYCQQQTTALSYVIDVSSYNDSYKMYIGSYTSDGHYTKRIITSVKVN